MRSELVGTWRCDSFGKNEGWGFLFGCEVVKRTIRFCVSAFAVAGGTLGSCSSSPQVSYKEVSLTVTKLINLGWTVTDSHVRSFSHHEVLLH